MTHTNPSFAPVKIAVVGTGNVGASFAYALLLSGLASEIVLIDLNAAKAQGEAMDLAHSAPFAHATQVRAGDYADCAGAAVTVVTAGANQKPGESRLELTQKNAGIFRPMIESIASANPGGLILVATNPVDVLTRLSAEVAGFAPGRVLGSGTILDTARFRAEMGEHLGVSPQSVQAFIVGEHGDSSVPAFSSARVGGLSLDEFCAQSGKTLGAEEKTAIHESVRDAAQHIIQRKGATYYAIGAGLVEVVRAIVRDENAVSARRHARRSARTRFGLLRIPNRCQS
jgi:L-lactate dehydrogenase